MQIGVNFGRINLRKQDVGIDVVADIDVELLEIAVGAGIDGRLLHRPRIAGELQLEIGGRALGQRDFHDRQRIANSLRIGLELRFDSAARKAAQKEQAAQQGKKSQGDAGRAHRADSRQRFDGQRRIVGGLGEGGGTNR